MEVTWLKICQLQKYSLFRLDFEFFYALFQLQIKSNEI